MKTLVLLLALIAVPILLTAQADDDIRYWDKSDFEVMAGNNDTAQAIVKMFYEKGQALGNAAISYGAVLGLTFMAKYFGDDVYAGNDLLPPEAKRMLFWGTMIHIPIFAWAIARDARYNKYVLYNTLHTYQKSGVLPWYVNVRIHHFLPKKHYE